MRTIEFMANSHSHKIDFIFPHGDVTGVETILEYLLEQKNWDLLKLEDILETSPVAAMIEKKWEASRLLWYKRAIRFSPYIPIQSDWTSFLSTRSTRFRKNMRNRAHRLEKLGEVQIEEHSRIDNLDAFLAQVQDITRRSWQGRRGSSIFSTRANANFYVQLADWANREGYFVLWLLRLNGTPIAYEYHLRSGLIEFGIKAEYDNRFNQASPGGVLDQFIVESLFDRGFKKYDLLGYMDSYKMRWTDYVDNHLRYYVFRKKGCARIPFWLDFTLREYLRRFRILREIKKSIARLRGDRSGGDSRRGDGSRADSPRGNSPRGSK